MIQILGTMYKRTTLEHRSLLLVYDARGFSPPLLKSSHLGNLVDVLQ